MLTGHDRPDQKPARKALDTVTNPDVKIPGYDLLVGGVSYAVPCWRAPRPQWSPPGVAIVTAAPDPALPPAHAAA